MHAKPNVCNIFAFNLSVKKWIFVQLIEGEYFVCYD